jgi:F-type H+-transporting ATPase subunit epsilon
MSGERALHLQISTPTEIIVDEAVLAVRAEDDSGSFGVLPGAADLVTALPPGVLRWRPLPEAASAAATRKERFCAVGGGVLTVRNGMQVRVAAREGVVGNELEALRALTADYRTRADEAVRRARTEQTRLHARAVRQLTRLLGAGGDSDVMAPALFRDGPGDDGGE